MMSFCCCVSHFTDKVKVTKLADVYPYMDCDIEQVNLYLSSAQMNAILLVILVLMPGAAIVAGVLVWRRRRH